MQIIYSSQASPSFHLAAEEYYFSTDEEILLLYVNTPSVIIGSNQVLANEIDVDFCRKNNIEIVRRLSGGGSVYHDAGNLNYCFIRNKQQNESPLKSDFLNLLANVLKKMNVPVEIGQRKDIWLDGYKISGTASHVSKQRVLFHGTLLYDADVTMLEKTLSPTQFDATKKGIRSVSSPVKNIRDYFYEKGMETVEASDFFQLLACELQHACAASVTENFSQQTIEAIKTLQHEKYTNNDWTYRK